MILFSALISMGSINSDDSTAYSSNEQLKYLMYYGWFDGGYASLSIINDSLNNQNLLHAKLNAKTIGLTNRLYNVSDIYESYFYKNTGLPKLAIRNVSEGKYKDYNEVEFFQNDGYVISQKSGKVTVPEKSLDIISAFYFTRNIIRVRDLKVDSIIKLNTYFGDEEFPLIIRYMGEEIIKTELGEINCLKFMPVVETGRVFKTENDMTIWFSNDKNVLPVRVQFELFIGSLKCDLIEFSGLKHELKFVQ